MNERTNKWTNKKHRTETHSLKYRKHFVRSNRANGNGDGTLINSCWHNTSLTLYMHSKLVCSSYCDKKSELKLSIRWWQAFILVDSIYIQLENAFHTNWEDVEKEIQQQQQHKINHSHSVQIPYHCSNCLGGWRSPYKKENKLKPEANEGRTKSLGTGKNAHTHRIPFHKMNSNKKKWNLGLSATYLLCNVNFYFMRFERISILWKRKRKKAREKQISGSARHQRNR